MRPGDLSRLHDGVVYRVAVRITTSTPAAAMAPIAGSAHAGCRRSSRATSAITRATTRTTSTSTTDIWTSLELASLDAGCTIGYE